MIIPRLSPVIYYGVVSCDNICEFNLILTFPIALRKDDDVMVVPAQGIKGRAFRHSRSLNPRVHTSETKRAWVVT